MVHSADRTSNSMKHRFFNSFVFQFNFLLCFWWTGVRQLHAVMSASTQFPHNRSINKLTHTHTRAGPLNVPVHFVCLHLLLTITYQSRCNEYSDCFRFYYVFVWNIILLLFIAICCTKTEIFVLENPCDFSASVQGQRILAFIFNTHLKLE